MLQRPVVPLRRWARAAAICAGLAPAGAAPGRAQPAAPPGVEVADVPLVAWVAARLHALPDTLTTFAVDDTRLGSFASWYRPSPTRTGPGHAGSPICWTIGL